MSGNWEWFFFMAITTPQPTTWVGQPAQAPQTQHTTWLPQASQSSTTLSSPTTSFSSKHHQYPQHAPKPKKRQISPIKSVRSKPPSRTRAARPTPPGPPGAESAHRGVEGQQRLKADHVELLHVAMPTASEVHRSKGTGCFLQGSDQFDPPKKKRRYIYMYTWHQSSVCCTCVYLQDIFSGRRLDGERGGFGWNAREVSFLKTHPKNGTRTAKGLWL